jgi:hypothetical protein
MPYAPDYGLMLLNQGHDKDFLVTFSTFRLSHISAVEPGLFTTIVNIPGGDIDFAMSVDFSDEILQNIISHCPQESSDAIVNWANDLRGSATLQLPEPVIFSLVAQLGEVQTNGQESYAPFVAQSVSGFDQ